MEEYTNESVDVFEEALEGDTQPETHEEPVPEPVTESEPAEAEQETETPEPEPAPQTIRIKYNGEEKDLSLEEAVTLSQKGMNYDRMVQRYEDKLTNSRELQILDFFAQTYGKTRDEYVEFLWNQRESAIEQQEAAALRKQYPDAPEALIDQMSKERAKARTAEIERVTSEKKKTAEDQRLKPWYEFAQAYPEDAKDLSALPAEVLEATKNGEHPVSAMRAYQLKQAQAEIEALKQEIEKTKKTEAQNKKNRKSAIGSVGSTASDPVSDPFLAALFSD